MKVTVVFRLVAIIQGNNLIYSPKRNARNVKSYHLHFDADEENQIILNKNVDSCWFCDFMFY